MILRVLALAGGVTTAAGLSQFTEFSQQYVQRLGGAVDELAVVVSDFDASAEDLGLSRDEALEQMTGSAFVTARRGDMQRTFARYEILRADLAALEAQGPFMRAYNVSRFRDASIAARAWEAYRPALPLSFAGMVFAGVGFVLGLLAVRLGAGLLRLPFSRRRPA